MAVRNCSASAFDWSGGFAAGGGWAGKALAAGKGGAR